MTTISLIAILAAPAHADLLQLSPAKASDKENLAVQAISHMESGTGRTGSSNESHSVIDKLNEVATNTVRNFTQTGIASWYGRQFHGRKTASGSTFNMNEMTAAHRTLPLNCLIKVTDRNTGKSVVVKVTDRGPFAGDRVLDLSYGAAKALGIVNMGTAKVNIERLR